MQLTDYTEDAWIFAVFFVITAVCFTSFLISIRRRWVWGIIKYGGVVLVEAVVWYLLAPDLWDTLKYIASRFWLLSLCCFGAAGTVVLMILFYRDKIR